MLDLILFGQGPGKKQKKRQGLGGGEGLDVRAWVYFVNPAGSMR